MGATINNNPELFDRMERSINRLLKKHNISIYGTSKTNVGEAEPEYNRIRIPAIFDIYSVYVIFHEIAHVIYGHYLNPERTSYQQEMEAERYALHQLRRFSIHKLYPDTYNQIRKDASEYVMKFIKQELEKGAKCEEISVTVYNFLRPHLDSSF